MNATSPKANRGHYDSNYGNFESDLYAEIRREAFGEDIGQNSWLTADEQDRFMERLELSSAKRVLDIGCGAGGPALRIAEKSGCSVVGVDVHESAVTAAKSLGLKHGLVGRAEFRLLDGAAKLPFSDAEFDAVTCIDAVNHLPNRPDVFLEWKRVLKPAGRLLFTDPITMTGPLSNEEMTIRSSLGYFLFVPAGYDRQLLEQCGFQMLACEDVTKNMAEVAEKRRRARAKREAALRKIEGDDTYNGQQVFLEVASRLARERRLSRFLFVAEKKS